MTKNINLKSVMTLYLVCCETRSSRVRMSMHVVFSFRITPCNSQLLGIGFPGSHHIRRQTGAECCITHVALRTNGSGVCAIDSPEPRLKGEVSYSRKRSFVSRPVCFDRPERGKDNKEARLFQSIHIVLCCMRAHFPIIIFKSICLD